MDVRWGIALLAGLNIALLMIVSEVTMELLVWLMPFASLVFVCAIALLLRPGRSAFGTALFEQSKSFELYLTTVEARQLRWELQNDVFSRYLPYAVVYGCTARWLEVGRQAMAEYGMPVPFWMTTCDAFAWAQAGDGLVALLESINEVIDSFEAMGDSASDFGGGDGGDGGGGD